MVWEVDNEEFESVLVLPGIVRYEYFVKRAASHGQLWGLRGDGGWVVADDDHGNHLPVWPHQRFADACATGPWQGEEPVPIDVDEWVMGWLPQLEEDGMCVAVFQTPDDQGVSCTGTVEEGFRGELEQFEL